MYSALTVFQCSERLLDVMAESGQAYIFVGASANELGVALCTSCKTVFGDPLHDEVSCRGKYAFNCIHIWLSVSI